MALGHLMIGVAAGLLAVLMLTLAGQPLWRVALAYSLVGSLTVVTRILLELWRMRPAAPGRTGGQGPLCADRRRVAGIKT